MGKCKKEHFINNRAVYKCRKLLLRTGKNLQFSLFFFFREEDSYIDQSSKTTLTVLGSCFKKMMSIYNLWSASSFFFKNTDYIRVTSNLMTKISNTNDFKHLDLPSAIILKHLGYWNYDRSF